MPTHAPIQPNTAFQQPDVSAPDGSTFAAGLRLLPGSVRQDVYRLYHVMRSLDDLVDEYDPKAEERVDAVERWAHGEHADSPEVRVMADLSERYVLSPQAVLAGCEALRHDLAREVIETEEDLERYCQRTGGTVLVLLAQLLGVSGPKGERMMAMLGRAVQRTNILRDIDEDLAYRRVYIARTTIERFGFPTPGARELLLRDQIARADELYEQAAEAPRLLLRGQRAIAACAALYCEILREIERQGYGSKSGRVVVPAWRRRLLIIKHMLTPNRA